MKRVQVAQVGMLVLNIFLPVQDQAKKSTQQPLYLLARYDLRHSPFNVLWSVMWEFAGKNV